MGSTPNAHSMTELESVTELSTAEIQRLVEAGISADEFSHGGGPSGEVETPVAWVPDPDRVSPATTLGYRHFEPLANATDDFVFQAKTISDRIYTGIDAFDEAMRGLGPKQLLLVQGYTHSGKTLFTTNMLRFNKDRRVAVYTPDEDRVSILIKLVSLEHGISAIELEDRIARGDRSATDLIRQTAEELYPNLVVFEDIDDLATMNTALDEAEDHWGAAAELVVFDYVDLLTSGLNPGEGETKAKIKSLKAWGRRRAPLVGLHQTSRTAGADGAEQTISSGSYGGESEATYLVGVRRKRDYWGGMVRELEERKRRSTKWGKPDEDKLDEAKYQLANHRNTVSFALLKNKRPPSTLVPELDFELDAKTGLISPTERAFMDTSNLGAAAKAVVRQLEAF